MSSDAHFVQTPTAYGSALFHAAFKQSPDDFVVNEELGFPLDGEGEHLYLHIQKQGLNTHDIVQALESAYGVRSQDVGLAGLKDRHATTSQWFSVVTPAGPEGVEQALKLVECENGRAQLINCSRHGRKLRRGAHRANQFIITLRDLVPANGDSEHLSDKMGERIEQLMAQGFPNYLGPQRFGDGGRNIQRARQWFRQPKKRTSRQQRSLWLSAARSLLFNVVCASRVSDGSWLSILPGEPVMLDGTHSFFDAASESAEALMQRLAAQDIHPTAPWWGRGRNPASNECEKREACLLQPYVDICQGLERAGLTQERRALRARVYDLSYRLHNDTTLELSFHLAPGNFATTLLQELGHCLEPQRSQQN